MQMCVGGGGGGGGRLVSCDYSFAFGPSNIVVKGNKTKGNVTL